MHQAKHMKSNLHRLGHLEGNVILEVIFHPKWRGIPFGLGLSPKFALPRNIVNTLLQRFM